MIKYVEFPAYTDFGKNIHVIDGPDARTSLLVKTAGMNYAPEIMDFVKTMNRKPGNIYVVVNALGADESWGVNTQGDAFPRSALTHVSLRSDVNSPNDYGYKTFEYYGNLYKHHINKDPNRSYGRVMFSHWNAAMDRVELIVEIYSTSKDIIQQIEDGEVCVSMGCKIARDRCSICGNMRGQGTPLCKHCKDHLKEIIDEATAKQWSKELGKIILPGTQVKLYNDTPRFFDISIVVIGADRISFVLGKVASHSIIVPSIEMPLHLGITDAWFEKVAYNKIAIDKEIDGSKEKIDGKILGKLKESLNNASDVVYGDEDEIPDPVLDSMSSTNDPRSVISTMLHMGIVPRPKEFQRIVLIAMKRPQEAAAFNPYDVVTPASENMKTTPGMANDFFGPQHFSSTLAEILGKYAASRSLFHGNFLTKMSMALEKKAEERKEIPAPSNLRSIAAILGLAALYAIMKAKANNINPEDAMVAMKKAPYLKALFFASPLLIANAVSKAQKEASEGIGFTVNPDPFYRGVGIEKNAAFWQAAGIGAMSVPAYYVMRAHNKNRVAAGIDPVSGTDVLSRNPVVGGAMTAGGIMAGAKFGPKLLGMVKK